MGASREWQIHLSWHEDSETVGVFFVESGRDGTSDLISDEYCRWSNVPSVIAEWWSGLSTDAKTG